MTLPFRKGQYFKHVKERDHVIYVQTIELVGDDYCVIQVDHVNPGYTGKPWPIPGPSRYKILCKDYKDYVIVEYDDLFKKRAVSPW
jgi:hypothetical protein